MERIKNNNVQFFTKLTQRGGVSLIVLVITIIVILILAAAVILTINNNNPIAEANKARYESDIDNMQAVFTNTVTKVMARNRATVSITANIINSITSGVSKTTGEVVYTVTDSVNNSNKSGKIIFDKGTNTDTVYYTGKQLPIYSAGETVWYVDSEGNISLGIGKEAYGNGAYANLSENTLVKMYENFAGDEDGATVGKLHIGDYVDYNPIANGITEKTESNGYVYISPNSKSGVSEAINDGFTSSLSKVSNQKFTTKEDLKWRVIGSQGANILIAPEIEIIPDTPVTFFGFSGYVMYGATSCLYGVDELNNISKIYGKGKLAEYARSMTIEDVNKITGVMVTETDILPSGVDMIGLYGTEYSFEAGSEAGWSPEAWFNKNDGSVSPGISGKINGYTYMLEDANLKTKDAGSVRYSVLDSTGYSIYGLASIGILSFEDRAVWGPAAVAQGSVSSYTGNFSSDPTATMGRSYGVRPVVLLKSNVTGEILSTDENGVATWHITLNEE